MSVDVSLLLCTFSLQKNSCIMWIWKQPSITDSVVALHCCKAHAKINMKMGNSSPCKIVPPKISYWNCEYEITLARLPAMQILVSVHTVGASPQIGEMLSLCDFFDCPVLYLPFFSILRPGRTAGPIFTLYGSNDVFPHKDGPFWSYNNWWPYLGEVCLQTPQKWAWIGNFKPKRHNMKIVISPKL